MTQSRGLIREIFKNFINSLVPKKYWGVIVGRDHLGTTYYEIPTDLPAGSQRRRTRWFVPRDPSNFEQEIPPQWSAWLRHRRKLPPTEEEIQQYLMNLEKIKRMNKESNKNSLKEHGDDQLTPNKSSYPVYDIYEEFPGAKK